MHFFLYLVGLIFLKIDLKKTNQKETLVIVILQFIEEEEGERGKGRYGEVIRKVKVFKE